MAAPWLLGRPIRGEGGAGDKWMRLRGNVGWREECTTAGFSGVQTGDRQQALVAGLLLGWPPRK